MFPGSAGIPLEGLVGGVTNASPRREAKSLMGHTHFPSFVEGVHSNKHHELSKDAIFDLGNFMLKSVQ